MSSAGVLPGVLATQGEAPAGVPVWAWTVETPEDAKRYVKLGAQGIITDAPSAVLKALRDSSAK